MWLDNGVDVVMNLRKYCVVIGYLFLGLLILVVVYVGFGGFGFRTYLKARSYVRENPESKEFLYGSFFENGGKVGIIVYVGGRSIWFFSFAFLLLM